MISSHSPQRPKDVVVEVEPTDAEAPTDLMVREAGKPLTESRGEGR